MSRNGKKKKIISQKHEESLYLISFSTRKESIVVLYLFFYRHYFDYNFLLAKYIWELLDVSIGTVLMQTRDKELKTSPIEFWERCTIEPVSV